jgi:hypothetical protein
MRKLITIILFASLVIIFIPSCAPKAIYTSVPDKRSGSDKTEPATAMDLPVRIDSFNLVVLPPSNGVQFYKGGVVFLSLTKNENKMPPNHLSFGTLQAYYSEITEDVPGPGTLFSPAVSFPYPCEAVTFSKDFKTMYFTMKSESDKMEKIYHAQFSNGSNDRQEWFMDSIPLSFCTGRSSYSHPALSSDGNFMIFASNRPESIGGMDLFITRKEADKWTTPLNLGRSVNSGGNDLFPFLDNDNNLFYSSDGLPGKGGYDIFMSRYNGRDWGKALNLTGHVNSEKDEISFKINPNDGKSAIFAARDKDRLGTIQLYRMWIKETAPLKGSSQLSGILYSMAGGKISDEELKLAAVRKKPEEIVKLPEKEEKKADIKTEKKAETKAEIKAEIKTETRAVTKVSADAGKKVESMPLPGEVKETVVYKVQFLSSIRPKGISSISVGNKDYRVQEYIYLGEYRYATGDFNTLREALELRNAIRNSGYADAFVVAFKNNQRTNDPALFR